MARPVGDVTDLIKELPKWKEAGESKSLVNLGTDEEGSLIANCERCGLHGVRVSEHECSRW